MKKTITFCILFFITLVTMGQDGKYVKGQKPTLIDQSKKHVEAGGYDVTFTCNVASATMYIDGKNYGTANGNRFLQTGKHTVRLEAEDYEPLTQIISVKKKLRTFSFMMKKVVGYDVTFTCNVPFAVLYIDSVIAKLDVNGRCFLNTGAHTVRYEAKDYAVLTQNIVVDSGSRTFSFKMNPLPVVVRNLINNMVYVEGGTFLMGGSLEHGDNPTYYFEKPLIEVTLSPYSIGKYEVTQKEWETVMDFCPSHFKGAKLPVEYVRWDDCQAFIQKLNAMTGMQFRLPTEAEWEYAARGGKKSRGYKYAGGNDIGSVAWYIGNSNKKTHEVGTKQPNELGLYDMSGNVWEWCQDWFGKYSSQSMTNPVGPSSGFQRVICGGGMEDFAENCRVAIRDQITPGSRLYNLGLRLTLSESSHKE